MLHGDHTTLPQTTNEHRTSAITFGLPILVAVCSFAFFVAYMQLKGVLNAPPAPGGDAVDYELIANNLAADRGFTRDGVIPAVDRPPLYPWLLSLAMRSGLPFVVIRIGQCVVLALVAGAVAFTLCRGMGVGPVVMVPFLLLADPRVRTMGAEILTEALACGLVSLLWIILAAWFRRPDGGKVVSAGIVLGLTILCRTMMAAWIPVLALALCFEKSFSPLSLNEKSMGRAGRAALLIVATLLVIAPWGYRNLSVLGEFRPLGTQGEEQLSAAWSDEAFARRGMWFNLDEFHFFERVSHDTEKPLAIRRAHLSQQAARSWVMQHPFKALLLPPLRVIQEFRPHGPGDLFVLAFAVFGLVLVWPTPEGRAARVILLAQTFAIAMTWSVAGRFLYPLLGILHYLAAVGLWGAYVTLIRDRQSSRHLLLRERTP